ncbi:MAG: hypothetical protein JW395_1369 [Nitrospira sp.]|nr:hypothetical protein [Nitrospira sp.]
MSPAKKKPIRLLLVDDHQVVLLGLRTGLHNRQGITVVGEAGSKAEATWGSAMTISIGLP